MEQILGSWKEIAAYLGKSTRTVQRWEAELGFPVHRPVRAAQHIVMAKRTEIDRWMEESSSQAASDAASAARASVPMPTVMIAEGDSGMRGLLGSLLELVGYPVQYAMAPRTVGQLFVAEKAVDLLVLGSNFAGRPGRELARSLARDSSAMKVLVLLDNQMVDQVEAWREDYPEPVAPDAPAQGSLQLAGRTPAEAPASGPAQEQTGEPLGDWPVLSTPVRSEEFLNAVRTLLGTPALALAPQSVDAAPAVLAAMSTVLRDLPRGEAAAEDRTAAA